MTFTIWTNLDDIPSDIFIADIVYNIVGSYVDSNSIWLIIKKWWFDIVILLLPCCTAEWTKINFASSMFFIKIDSSNSFDMTVAYNENFTAILWYTGIDDVARYCIWCETFNIIFSDTDIWSSFLSRWLINLMGWDFFELANAVCWTTFCDVICIFRQQWSQFVAGFKVKIHWSFLFFSCCF